jgi:hypothetical protein
MSKHINIFYAIVVSVMDVLCEIMDMRPTVLSDIKPKKYLRIYKVGILKIGSKTVPPPRTAPNTSHVLHFALHMFAILLLCSLFM